MLRVGKRVEPGVARVRDKRGRLDATADAALVVRHGLIRSDGEGGRDDPDGEVIGLTAV